MLEGDLYGEQAGFQNWPGKSQNPRFTVGSAGRARTQSGAANTDGERLSGWTHRSSLRVTALWPERCYRLAQNPPPGGSVVTSNPVT